MKHTHGSSALLRANCLLALISMLCVSTGAVQLVDKACQIPENGDSLVVVYFGDSITEGWMDGMLHPTSAYPAVVDSLLRVVNLPFRSVRSAVGGTTTEDALRSFDASVRVHTPRIVVIAFGSNDWYIHGYANSPRVAIEDYLRNVSLLCSAVIGLGATPILLGLPPLISSRFSEYSPARLYAPYGGADSLRRQYDRVLQQTARDMRIPYVSIQFSDAMLPNALGIDGVHPTLSGHDAIAHTLAPVIVQVAARTTSVSVPDAPAVRMYPQPLRARSGGMLAIEVDLPAPEFVSIDVYESTGRHLLRMTSFDAKRGTRYFFLQPSYAGGTLPGPGAYLVHVRAGRHSNVLPLIIQ